MQITTISDFQKDLDIYLKKVAKGSETLIVDTGSGSGVIILSLDEYNQLNTARHELLAIKNNEKIKKC